MLRKRKLVKLTLVLLYLQWCLAPIAVLAQDLPDFSDSASTVLSKTAEQQLGRMVLADIRRHMPLLNDDYANDYLQAIGSRLVSYSSMSHWPFSFFIVSADSINAFALPGGNIGVHTGLITAAHEESELAGVLAHEIAHVTQRHIARMYERASQLTLPTIAALLSSIILATQNPSAGTSAMAATVAGAQQYAINFTRDNEKEADRIGIGLMAQAGFDPFGMPNFFAKMLQANRFNQFYFPEFLRTHPVTEDRISDAKARAEKYPLSFQKVESFFNLIQVRIDILQQENSQENLLKYKQRYAQRKSLQPQQSRYGYAMALAANNDYKTAHQLASELQKNYPNNYLYAALLADIALKQEQTDKALSLIEEQLANYPDNLPLSKQKIQILLHAGNSKEALQAIEKSLQNHQQVLSLYQLQAEAASQAGIEWQTHASRAEFLALLGDYSNAIKQLQKALAASEDDHYVHAKLAVKQKKLRELAKKEK